jgi:hypothetical protein
MKRLYVIKGLYGKMAKRMKLLSLKNETFA